MSDLDFRDLAQNYAYEVKGDMGLSDEEYAPLIEAYMAGYLRGHYDCGQYLKTHKQPKPLSQLSLVKKVSDE